MPPLFDDLGQRPPRADLILRRQIARAKRIRKVGWPRESRRAVALSGANAPGRPTRPSALATDRRTHTLSSPRASIRAPVADASPTLARPSAARLRTLESSSARAWTKAGAADRALIFRRARAAAPRTRGESSSTIALQRAGTAPGAPNFLSCAGTRSRTRSPSLRIRARRAHSWAIEPDRSPVCVKREGEIACGSSSPASRRPARRPPARRRGSRRRAPSPGGSRA